MSRGKKASAKKEDPKGQQGYRLQKGAILPSDLEELDRRLEAAFVPFSDLHPNDLCIWACACFLVYDSAYANATDLSRS